MDGYANWLEGQIDLMKRDIEIDEWDEYLSGRQSGFESSLATYKEYMRRTAL
jgi:hypothetical protein